MIGVTLTQRVVSTVPGQVGNWSITRKVEYPAVPRSGDDVEMAGGWASAGVRRATFCIDGAVVVELEPIRTDSPDVLGDLDLLVSQHGWDRI